LSLELVVALVADLLVVLGLLVTTLGVAGMFRLPDVYSQLHAAGKAVFLGVVSLLVASLAAGDGSAAARAVIIALFLLLTTPVGAHAIARAAHARGEKMRSPGALDESEGESPPSSGPERPAHRFP